MCCVSKCFHITTVRQLLPYFSCSWEVLMEVFVEFIVDKADLRVDAIVANI